MTGDDERVAARRQDELRASRAPPIASGPAAPSRGSLALRFAPVAVFALIVGLGLFALFWKGDPSKVPSALIGRPVPAFSLEPVEGLLEAGRPVPGLKAPDLADGRPVVVNFWASWCQPCVDEHPQLIELKRRTGVRIVGINYKDQAAGARRFLSRYGNPFAAVGSDPGGKAAIEWGVYGMPETFVVDGRGVIVFKHVGPIGPEALERQLLPAVAEAARRSAAPGR